MLLENLRTIFRLRDYYRYHYDTGASDEAFIQWLAKSIPQMLADDHAAPKRTATNAAAPHK